uniref:Vitronectin a n=1 Tax=Hucho hucho TaxID=62062 RepID=A0A4W5LKQ7_9TELE
PEDGESSYSWGQRRQPTCFRTPNTTPTPTTIASKTNPVTEPATGTARGPQGGQVPLLEAAKTTKAPSASHAGKGPQRDQVPPCRGRPRDSVMQLKNGYVYAFRGSLHGGSFLLDEKLVIPGIRGPIHINCQGKTYMFKGNKYWRFDDGEMKGDYPRDINVGFEKIPHDVDAAFAIAAPGHHAIEKVYFFKGDQYYQYEFKQQSSHEECIKMSELFNMLFRGIPNHHGGHRFINKDWIGIKAPVDAFLDRETLHHPQATGRSAKWTAIWTTICGWDQDRDRRRDNQDRRRDDQDRRRDGYNYDSRYNTEGRAYWEFVNKGQPVQSVYFFKGDKYYKVYLKTKKVDPASPPHPRSIGKYWLSCPEKHLGAENK